MSTQTLDAQLGRDAGLSGSIVWGLTVGCDAGAKPSAEIGETDAGAVAPHPVHQLAPPPHDTPSESQGSDTSALGARYPPGYPTAPSNHSPLPPSRARSPPPRARGQTARVGEGPRPHIHAVDGRATAKVWLLSLARWRNLTGADRLHDGYMWVELLDGRVVQARYDLFPRLRDATDEQRARWSLIGDGVGIHWPEVDEGLSTSGLIRDAVSIRPARSATRAS